MDMKILIVEDEEAISWTWKKGLEAKNYKINVAKDGEEALKMAKSFCPDIILLDILLPKKSGLDVLKELKDNPDLKNIPVVVMSNLADDETIKKALALGATDYFARTQHSIYEIIEKFQKYIAK